VRYALRCKTCGEVTWIRGNYEEDVNFTNLDETDSNWGSSCEHVVSVESDFDIVDSEVEDDEGDWL
jgi:hypothetical protein